MSATVGSIGTPGKAPAAAGTPYHPTDAAPRILFVPVSGAFGMGEFARSLAIAHAVRRRWRAAAIHFILSRQAPYAAGLPFPTTMLESSPTFHTSAVVGAAREFRPDVAIFDNAGRTAQLRAVRAAGARVVFISARRRQRKRAFRWRWMGLLDEHWIAYPRFVAGRLGPLEILKLRIAGRPVVRFLDVLLPPPDAPGARPGPFDAAESAAFALVVPGGGTGHPRARDAVGQFHAAARSLAAAGVPTRFVGAASAAARDANPLLQECGLLPQADLIRLMRAARLVVTNGGDTMLQAIACAVACVAAPIAGDQAGRIRRCAAAGAVHPAALDGGEIARAATALWQDAPALAALAARSAALGLSDGIGTALDAIDGLLRSMNRV